MTTTIRRHAPTGTTSGTTSRSGPLGRTSGRARPRPRWPLFGVVAGAAAFAATVAGMQEGLTEEDSAIGLEVLSKLDRGSYHVAFLLGLVSIGCLLVASTGWKRWADERAGDNLAARTIPTALAATAGVNIIGYSLAGSLALYLPGGTDEGWLAPEGQLAAFHFLDFGFLFGWWGAVLAAVCVATLAFGRDRLLPRWMGVVSALLVLPPVASAAAIGLPGLPGFAMPIWLVVVSTGMVFSRTAHGRPRLAR